MNRGRESHKETSATSGELSSVWKWALKEIFGGPRGLTKMSHLWLPLALLLLSCSAPDLKTAFPRTLGLIFAVLCKVQFSILSNDLCDRREDQAAGKKRWIGFLPGPVGLMITSSLLAAGLTTVLLMGGSLRATLVYAGTILLGLFYSLKPLRFKERGIWGLLVYALSATMIFVLVPWTWFPSGPVLLIALLAAVMSDKWVQIHFHQVVDHAADLHRATRTYAVRAGLDRARSTLRHASFVASIMLLGMLGLVLFLASPAAPQLIAVLTIAAAVLAVSRAYAARANRGDSPTASILTRELPWFYLGLTYLLFCVLPPVLFFYLARREPWLLVPMILSLFSLLGISWQSSRYRCPRGAACKQHYGITWTP
jgi:hypothetical protein